MADIRIDKEFRALIPPLSAEEREQLEANLKADGCCRDPLVVWDGLLLDGHNRYDICRKHGIKFKTVERECKDRDEALVWIIRNQFGRRNLPPYARLELALRLEPMIAAEAKKNQAATQFGKNRTVPSTPKRPTNYTDEQLGRLANLSATTVHEGKTVAARAPEPVKAALRAGKTTIHTEYKKLKAADPAAAAKRRQQKAKREDRDNTVTAFVLRADAAVKLAYYSGPVDAKVISMAKKAAGAWDKLVKSLEEDK